jgi:hypothetical protein
MKSRAHIADDSPIVSDLIRGQAGGRDTSHRVPDFRARTRGRVGSVPAGPGLRQGPPGVGGGGSGQHPPVARGFTLIEVMIALAIFFMASFAILELVAQNLRIARGLRLGELDFSSVAAELSLTNRLEEGVSSGDFGDLRPGATWTADTFLYSTGGLYQVDVTVNWPDNGLMKERKASLLLYRPDSGRGGVGRR